MPSITLKELLEYAQENNLGLESTIWFEHPERLMRNTPTRENGSVGEQRFIPSKMVGHVEQTQEIFLFHCF